MRWRHRPPAACLPRATSSWCAPSARSTHAPTRTRPPEMPTSSKHSFVETHTIDRRKNATTPSTPRSRVRRDAVVFTEGHEASALDEARARERGALSRLLSHREGVVCARLSPAAGPRPRQACDPRLVDARSQSNPGVWIVVCSGRYRIHPDDSRCAGPASSRATGRAGLWTQPALRPISH
jgi:hypothetical protein